MSFKPNPEVLDPTGPATLQADGTFTRSSAGLQPGLRLTFAWTPSHGAPIRTAPRRFAVHVGQPLCLIGRDVWSELRAVAPLLPEYRHLLEHAPVRKPIDWAGQSRLVSVHPALFHAAGCRAPIRVSHGLGVGADLDPALCTVGTTFASQGLLLFDTNTTFFFPYGDRDQVWAQTGRQRWPWP